MAEGVEREDVDDDVPQRILKVIIEAILFRTVFKHPIIIFAGLRRIQFIPTGKPINEDLVARINNDPRSAISLDHQFLLKDLRAFFDKRKPGHHINAELCRQNDCGGTLIRFLRTGRIAVIGNHFCPWEHDVGLRNDIRGKLKDAPVLRHHRIQHMKFEIGLQLAPDTGGT